MKTWKIALALAALALGVSAAWGDSSPGFRTGQIPTAAQWNAAFSAKQDALNFTPVNKAGDTMLGRLITSAPLTTTSGFRLPAGSAPTSPIDGDVWTTTSGMYVRINGTTMGPLAAAAGTSLAATSPLTISFPAGVATYAFDLSVANAWTATQSNANAAGWSLINGAASATVPTLVPNKASPTTGIGAQASGNLSAIVSGAEVARITSGGLAMQAGTSSSIPSLTVTTAFTATGLVTNADLANASTTVNGTTCTLGSTCSVTATAASATIGTTTVLSGTTNRVLYDNAGVLGELIIGNGLENGSGTLGLSAARRTGITTSSCIATGTTCSNGGFSSGTYTTPANVLWLEVRMKGSGGGGGGSGTGSPAAGGTAGNTCWNTTGAACTTPVYQAGGGVGGATSASGLGGAGGAVAGSATGYYSIIGNTGRNADTTVAAGPPGGNGGGGGGGAGGNANSGPGSGNFSTGGGGGGGTSIASAAAAGGGGEGAEIRFIINSPASTYTYSVGAIGTAGTTGTGGQAGATGALGGIWIIEHYN